MFIYFIWLRSKAAFRFLRKTYFFEWCYFPRRDATSNKIANSRHEGISLSLYLFKSGKVVKNQIVNRTLCESALLNFHCGFMVIRSSFSDFNIIVMKSWVEKQVNNKIYCDGDSKTIFNTSGFSFVQIIHINVHTYLIVNTFISRIRGSIGFDYKK